MDYINLGLDINTECIAYAFADKGYVREMGTIPFKSVTHETRAKDRLPHVFRAVQELDKVRVGLIPSVPNLTREITRVRMEEPVIGPGARASMMVGMFNGAVYGCLSGAGYEIEILHPSTWKADLRAVLEYPAGIRSKQQIVDALKGVPGLAERIKKYPKGVQQDIYDAVGLALGGQ